MSKSALEKIESHEKLCRIMQKQTHDRIEKIESSIGRIEKILIQLCTIFELMHYNHLVNKNTI